MITSHTQPNQHLMLQSYTSFKNKKNYISECGHKKSTTLFSEKIEAVKD